MASALTMGLTSCSDFLEEPIRGQQDMENYFTTEEECEKQITGCYNFIACDDWWQIYKFYNLCNITTDDCWMGNTTQDPGEYRVAAMFTGNTIELGNTVQNFWQYRYKGITQCNIAIEKIAQLKFNDEKYQKRLIAEAKFLRGFYYFELVKNFGGVPLVMSRCLLRFRVSPELPAQKPTLRLSRTSRMPSPIFQRRQSYLPTTSVVLPAVLPRVCWQRHISTRVSMLKLSLSCRNSPAVALMPAEHRNMN